MMSMPPDTGFDLDEMELKSDVGIHRGTDPPSNQPEPRIRTGKRPWLWVSLIANIGLAATLAYFFVEQQSLKEQLLATSTRSEDLARDSQSVQETLAAVQLDLKKITTENTDLRREIDRRKDSQSDLRGSLGEREKKLSDIENERDLIAQDKTRLEKERDVLLKQIEDWTKKQAKTVNELNQVKKESVRVVTELSDQVALLETKTTELNTAYKKEAANAKSFERQLSDIRKQFNEEAQASLDLIQERANLQRENREYKEQVLKLKQSGQEKDSRINELKNTQEGDLVPFSTEITPAEITYREPFPEDKNLSRRFGPYVIQALINEFGAVERAFFVNGQNVPAEQSRLVLETIFKFKFSPASLDGVRVKTWQPIIVER